jgi:hypothetical protein
MKVSLPAAARPTPPENGSVNTLSAKGEFFMRDGFRHLANCGLFLP